MILKSKCPYCAFPDNQIEVDLKKMVPQAIRCGNDQCAKWYICKVKLATKEYQINYGTDTEI